MGTNQKQSVASSQVAKKEKHPSQAPQPQGKIEEKIINNSCLEIMDVDPEEAEIMPKGKTERLSHFSGITPLHAVRLKCLDCSGYIPSEVKNCPIKNCLFYQYRMKSGRIKLRIIRKNCLECMGGSSDNVQSCTDKNCSLFPFRFGKNPNISEKTREQRRKQSMSLENYRKSQKHVAVLKETPSECD